MRRLLVAAVLAVMLGIVGLTGRVQRASADLYWCADDPVVTIDGHVFSVDVAIGLPGVGHVRGTVPIAIVLPDDSSGRLDRFDTRYFVPVVKFFHEDQAGDVAHFLGLPRDMVERQLDRDDAGRGSRVEVLSVVHSGPSVEFPARLFSDAGDHMDTAHSNQLMAIHFGLHDR